MKGVKKSVRVWQVKMIAIVRGEHRLLPTWQWLCGHAAVILIISGGIAISPIVAPAVEPIKIGAIMALSPPTAPVEQALEVREGLEIAKEIINQGGGLLGRSLEILIEDNKNSAEVARAAAEKLIGHGVIALTGEHQSAIVLSNIEVAHRRGILYVNTNGGADEIRLKGYPEVFSPNIWNSKLSDAAMDVIRSFGAKQVVSIAQKGSNGVRLGKQLGEALKGVAPGIAHRMETVEAADSDLTTTLRLLKDNPADLVICWTLPPLSYRLMRGLQEAGVAPTRRTWLLDGVGTADFRGFGPAVGEAAKYMLMNAMYHPAMVMPPLGKVVTDKYVAKHKKLPNRMIFQAADSVLLIAEAARRAGSTDTPSLIRQLREIQYTGTRGTVSFLREPGVEFQQWTGLPFVTYQITAAEQPIDQTLLLQKPDGKLNPGAALRPSR